MWRTVLVGATTQKHQYKKLGAQRINPNYPSAISIPQFLILVLLCGDGSGVIPDLSF